MVFKTTGLNDINSGIHVKRKEKRPKDRDLGQYLVCEAMRLSLIHISEPTRPY